MPGKVVYVSRSRIERAGGYLRRAFLPLEAQPVLFGIHSEVAQHYRAAPQEHEVHATTLDYVIAAVAA
jgi:hypothetical protein